MEVRLKYDFMVLYKEKDDRERDTYESRYVEVYIFTYAQ